MIRTQIQLPDQLYRQAQQLARGREISLAELVRRGLEYMISVAPEAQVTGEAWTLPRPRNLGGKDPFADPEWRANLHMAADLQVAELGGAYRVKRGRRR